MKLTSRMCSPAEIEMLEMMRQEEKIMQNEAKIYRQNGDVETTDSISSTEQAVRDIQRLREYVSRFYVNGEYNSVDFIISLHKNQIEVIKDFKHNRFDMNFYQQRASETAIYPGKETALGLIYCALKLSGEAGEVADNVGKALRDDGLKTNVDIKYDEGGILFERRNKIKLELGDVLWYVSQAAKELGFTLEEIAQANLDKLAARKDKGTLRGSGDAR